jgi:prevent-host-death family protein
MVLEVGAFEAKTQLSKLLERVRQGDRVVITKRGVPVAVLVPPGEIDRGHVTEVARKLRELRERTRKRPGSVRALRNEGRRR